MEKALEVVENLDHTLKPSLPISWGAATHVGKVREANEDTFLAEPQLALFVVSDGMGGHRGGEIASRIVIEDLPVMIETGLDKLKVGCPKAIKSLLSRSITEQSRQLWLEGTSESGYKDMGATLVTVLLRNKRCYVANLGDSRVYLFRKGRLSQLTRDHSVVSDLVLEGLIGPEEAKSHNARGEITSYIGMEEKPRPFMRSFLLKKNDRLLLCSDGLTDLVDDDNIAAILQGEPDSEAVCKELVKAANSAGGHDNITVMVVRWNGLS
ncbi:MAG: Stp1/IreP family PP2C-type Ser/Thr phosphatase [Sedimentisphaerales bacterium]|nr:Stp1/IreP family PP2C-type Ser/Thr phosphatase [Sedimentisphaerales bacterium]